ncbi:MAG: magnesium transporter [Elusimicrobia bacterium]|nr:magnesium transporter [Elusimicrobiota bacterium]
MKTLQIYLADLKELLKTRDFVCARTCLKEISPIDLADGWSYFDADERVAIFRLSTRQKAMQLFEELDAPAQAELAGNLQRKDAQELLSDLDPSATGRMLRDLPQPLVRQFHAIMKKGGFEKVQHYLQYPPETVGALMRGRYVTLDEKWTTRAAVERIQYSTRLRRIEETHLDTLMVVDSKGHIRGVVGLKSLVVAPNDMAVRELMDPAPRVLTPGMDQEEAVKLFTKYKLKSAPVVNADGLLLGVVVYRDIFAVASAETEEDFAKMAGFARPRTRSVLKSAGLRLPWLVITCLGGVLVSHVIKHFEPTLSQIIALASFSPLIAGMGGNVGSQTATIMVRGLATGEIGPGEELRSILHEVAIGCLLGLSYGVVIGALAGTIYHDRYGWWFAVVVGLSMSFSMTVASCMASIEPFVLRHFGVDPATATGPMITTTTDLLSNAFYFTLASWLLLR